MFTQLAQVFATHGVVLPGTEMVPFYGKPRAVTQNDQKDWSEGFAPRFEQAAAKLELSRQAIKRMEETEAARTGDKTDGPKGDSQAKESSAEGASVTADGRSLSEADRKQVESLKKGDREVKSHEAAHKASAGGNAGAAGFEYQTGPDGKRYAVGGHVSIDSSPVQGNPEATLRKAQTIQRSAMAPADPSGQDRAVAAAAVQMALQAQKEKGQENRSAAKTGSGAEAIAARDPRHTYRRESAKLGAILSVVG
ncbi:MAG: hypothetical protein M3Y08_13295 [Fibrobacterota bacterium]|nr:hypothetical protein [Fibrobacterota bacterium]